MSDKNLRADDLDRLGQTLITLAKELWVVKDRVKVLEAALTEANVLVPNQVDKFQPDAALSEELDKEREQLIEQVLGALEAEK